MNLGAAVLTFREGLEAALIIAILLGYLRKVNLEQGRQLVWIGAGSAVALTLAFVMLLQFLGAEFEGTAEEIFAGTTSLLAVGIVTYMTFWMARHGRQMKGKLEAEAEASLAGRRAGWGLLGLAFFAVIREGIETGLFLSAAAFASSGTETLIGGIAGLLLAIVVAGAIYLGGVRLNLSLFFRASGILLVIFGAAILRYGVHEFEEVGLLPPLVEHLWNTAAILPDGDGVGAVLQALVGYTAHPSLMQLIAYIGYFLIIGLALWRPWRQQDTPSISGQ